jgi:hypothetical protein
MTTSTNLEMPMAVATHHVHAHVELVDQAFGWKRGPAQYSNDESLPNNDRSGHVQHSTVRCSSTTFDNIPFSRN